MHPMDPNVVHLIGPVRRGRHGVITACGWEIDEREQSRLTHHEQMVTCAECQQQMARDEDITAGLTTSAEGGV